MLSWQTKRKYNTSLETKGEWCESISNLLVPKIEGCVMRVIAAATPKGSQHHNHEISNSMHRPTE